MTPKPMSCEPVHFLRLEREREREREETCEVSLLSLVSAIKFIQLSHVSPLDIHCIHVSYLHPTPLLIVSSHFNPHLLHNPVSLLQGSPSLPPITPPPTLTQMKDLSFFLFHNSLGAKMIKSFRAFCNGDASTSTLNQHRNGPPPPPPPTMPSRSPILSPPYLDDATLEENSPTLEEMIMQLEIEEKMARRSRMDEYVGAQRRMSCVNNSDILRSARNALNQYPRFSLDGKDAMYRSSFRNSPLVGSDGRKSFCCNRELRKAMEKSSRRLPPTLAGESVVWCKPGVVAKLMGLEAMPVPVNRCHAGRASLSSMLKKQSIKRRAERQEIGRRRLAMHVNGCNATRNGAMGSCSTPKYCVMKPISKQPANDEAGWPVRYFL